MKQIQYPVYQRGRIYHYHHRTNKTFTDDSFKFHYHTFFEIYLFVDGKADFVIEDKIYKLEKNDIMLVTPYKFHMPVPTSGIRFERMVLNVFPSFFSELHCENFIDILTKVAANHPHISYADAEKYDLISIIKNIDTNYNDDYTNKNILTSIKIAELMYNLHFLSESNTGNDKSERKSKDTVASEVMKYINKNFASITDVASVTDKFHYSKNYLNEVFKNNLGVSIAKYINIKRFENIENLYRSGKSMEQASVMSGFNNYRHFAYAYKAEYGISPRKGIKK